MDLLDSIGDHVREHRRGMAVDLAFAVIWVGAVSIVFDLLQGPQWAYYLTMALGVVAYFGFFASLEAARERREADETG